MQSSTEAFAPFYVQTRSFQRRILRSALELTEGDVAWAASAMGLEMTAFVEFCEALGGIFPGTVVIEPPPFMTITPLPIPVALSISLPVTPSEPDARTDDPVTIFAGSESEAKSKPEPKTEPDTREFWPREEVEKFLGLSTQGVLRLHQKGEIQTVFDREQAILLFRRDTVEEYSAKRQTQRDAKKVREDELASAATKG